MDLFNLEKEAGSLVFLSLVTSAQVEKKMRGKQAEEQEI
jgi:hypothetical protein